MSEAGGTPAPAATEPWIASWADEQLRGVAQNNGWDKLDPAQAAMQATKSFRETQAKLGVPADRVVRWPADAADEANWKIVRQKLGVPDTPEGYDFTAVTRPDGSAIDDGLAATLRAVAAATGTPKDAAAAIAAALVKHEADAKAADTVRQGAALGAAQLELATSWGANTAVNQVVANRTAGLLGFDPEFIQALPADKYVGFMQKMLEVGSRIGEASLVGNGAAGGGAEPRVMTREGAIARMNELGNDKAWYARFNNPSDPGHKAAVDEWRHLNQLQAGGAR